MPSLRDAQTGFARAILDEAAPEWLAAIDRGRFGVERHVQVYRHNVTASLTGALAAVYPVIVRLVGRGFFDYAADAYLRQAPPRSGNLHDFGESFGDFLRAFPAAVDLPYLRDVARLEWAWHRAFHAADAPALDLRRLGDVSPRDQPRLVFRLHPSVQLLKSPYPILRIWQVNQPEHTGDTRVDLAEGGEHVLVMRPAIEVELVRLSAPEFDFLRACDGGAALGEAATALTDASSRLPPPIPSPARGGGLGWGDSETASIDFSLTEALQRHIVLGTFSDFHIQQLPTGVSA